MVLQFSVRVICSCLTYAEARYLIIQFVIISLWNLCVYCRHGIILVVQCSYNFNWYTTDITVLISGNEIECIGKHILKFWRNVQWFCKMNNLRFYCQAVINCMLSTFTSCLMTLIGSQGSCSAKANQEFIFFVDNDVSSLISCSP